MPETGEKNSEWRLTINLKEKELEELR